MKHLLIVLEVHSSNRLAVCYIDTGHMQPMALRYQYYTLACMISECVDVWFMICVVWLVFKDIASYFYNIVRLDTRRHEHVTVPQG